MALTAVEAGEGFGITSSPSLDVTPSVSFSVGDLVVVCIAADNAGTGGAGSIVDVEDSSGNTYTARAMQTHGGAVSSNTAGTVAIFTARVDVALTVASTITVNFSPDTVAKAAVLWKVTSGLGAYSFPSSITDYGNSTQPIWTGFSVTANDMVIAAAAFEDDATSATRDGDSTGGASWSDPLHLATADAGAELSSQVVASQWKVPTSTATQNWNLTFSAAHDWESAGITIREESIVALTGTADLGALSASATYTVSGSAASGGAGPLGCGLFGVALVHRSYPDVILADLSADALEAECERHLNEVAEATLTLKQCYAGPPITPWRHAFRFAWDDGFIWLGPVTSVRDDGNGNGIYSAIDMMGWMKVRKNRLDYDSTGSPVDVASIFEALVSAGFNQDPSVTITLSITATGITAERKYSAGKAEYVYDAINELVTTGIDWTAIEDTIIAGNVEIAAATIGVLHDSHLEGKPELTRDGMGQGNFVTVVGSGRGYADDAITGIAQDGTSQVDNGLIDLIENESTIEDQVSLDVAASTRLALRKDALLLVGDLELAPTAPLSVADLIPGALVAVSLDGTHVSYAGYLRIETVRFEMRDGRWHVTLSAQPVGTQGGS